MRYPRTPQVRLRLYTEAVNLDKTLKLANHFFDGFTVTTGKGVWKGQEEVSICIEVIGPPTRQEVFEELAERIRVQNHQEAVLVTCEPVEAAFIS